MFTKYEILKQLKALCPEVAPVTLVHTSLRAIGKLEGGAEALLDTLWTYEYRSDIRTVDVHIRRLREKLEENPAEPKYIITKWGVGYYFKK
jgi:hypothetical protein